MSELVAAEIPGYKELVEKVFIDPIRSVLAIDDEFPSLDDLFDPEQRISENGKKLKNILNLCRNSRRNWLLDIFNGKDSNNASEVPLFSNLDQTFNRLYQSDLLLLDYNLKPEDHQLCLDIVKKVAQNKHFNLVVIYTGAELNEVFNRVLLSLRTPWDKMQSDGLPENIAEKLDECGLDQDDLAKSIDIGGYIELRRNDVRAPQNPKGEAFLADFQRLADEVGLECREKISAYKWVLSQIEIQHGVASGNPDNIRYGFKGEGHSTAFWLRTERLFLTVVSKQDADPLEGLLSALNSWRPSPNRLMSAFVRRQIEANGVSAEDAALMDTELQYGWLHQVLQQDDYEQNLALEQLFKRNMAGILEAIKADVLDHSKEVLSCITPYKADLHPYFGAKEYDQKRSVLKLNAYCSGMKPTGSHLTTGHILHLADGDQYWICLTPACDLVPSQPRHQDLGEYLPAKFVRLYPDIDDDDALDQANSNMCVFLSIGDDLKTFEFRPGEAESRGEPRHRTMYAHNRGKFDPILPEITVSVTTAPKNKDGARGGIILKDKTARIIAQLRYEYAINLMQTLGGSLTRVGLDYVRLPAGETTGNEAENPEETV